MYPDVPEHAVPQLTQEVLYDLDSQPAEVLEMNQKAFHRTAGVGLYWRGIVFIMLWLPAECARDMQSGGSSDLCLYLASIASVARSVAKCIAMVPTPFWAFVFMVSVSTGAGEVYGEYSRGGYTYAFEGLVTLIMALVGLNFYLLSKGPSHKTTAQKMQADAAVQRDDLPERENKTPAGAIFVAPHGARWHSRKDCQHLKHASKSTQLTPCQTCMG